MTRPNATRLVGVYQWARDNPEEHDQTAWGQRNATCGTALCIAGKVVSDDVAPERLVWVPDEEDIEIGCHPADTTWWLQHVEMPVRDHEVDETVFVTIADRARELLGLTEERAAFLFNGANTLDIIRDWITHYIGIDPDAADALVQAVAYDARTASVVSAVLSPDASIPGADAIAACTTPTMYLPTIQDGPR